MVDVDVGAIAGASILPEGLPSRTPARSPTPNFDVLLSHTLNGTVESHVRPALTSRQVGLLRVVNEEPALNIRELADRMRFKRSTASHHARKLVRLGCLVTVRQGRHRLHFTQWMPAVERQALAALRIGSARAIVGVLFENPGINTRDLANRVALRPRTVRATVHLLARQSILRLEKVAGTRARIVHLDAGARIAWARWFQANWDAQAPTPLQSNPGVLAMVSMVLLTTARFLQDLKGSFEPRPSA